MGTPSQTSIQRGLGVEIGRLVVDAMISGTTHDDVISTLDHCANLARLNRAMQVDFTSLACRVPQGTFKHEHILRGR